MPKNVQTTIHLHSSHKLAKQCSKFSRLGFNSMWTENFQIFNLNIEKVEESEIKLPTSTGSSKKQESSRKTSISALLTMPKPLTVWITINCGKFWMRWEYQTTWHASWEICAEKKTQNTTIRKKGKHHYRPCIKRCWSWIHSHGLFWTNLHTFIWQLSWNKLTLWKPQTTETHPRWDRAPEYSYTY